MTHTVVITNDGNVRLRAVTISTTLSTASSNAVTGLGAYGCRLNGDSSDTALGAGLAVPVGRILTCKATYTFDTVALIEAGNLSFNSLVTATGYGGNVAAGPVVVGVPALPNFSLTLDNSKCAAGQPKTSGGVVSNFAGRCYGTDARWSWCWLKLVRLCKSNVALTSGSTACSWCFCC